MSFLSNYDIYLCIKIFYSTLILEIFERGLFGDEIRVSNDGADKEAIIGDLLTFGHLGFAKVEVHFLVGCRQCLQLVRPQPIDFQLEGQRWFQVAIDAVLVELVARPEREELGVLSPEEDDERYAPDTALHQHVAFGQTEGRELFAKLCVFHHFGVADGHVDDVDGFYNLDLGSIPILALDTLLINTFFFLFCLAE